MGLKFILLFWLPYVIRVSTLQFESFGHCVKRSDSPSFITCAGVQALNTLQQFSDLNNYSLTDGLMVMRDETLMGRSAPISFLDQNPEDFRSLLENAGVVMSQRSLQWDMSRVHPGLQLRVGPSINGGLLEFVVDPGNQYDERAHLIQEDTTARIITKKFVLPFLLGIKFNLATLLPLILGVIILASKKIAFLSKMALFISGVFGAGSLASLGGYGAFQDGGYGLHRPPLYADSGLHHQHGGIYKVLESNTPRTQDDPEVLDHFYEYDRKQLLKDRSARLYERDIDHDKYSKHKQTNQRSFVTWQTN